MFSLIPAYIRAFIPYGKYPDICVGADVHINSIVIVSLEIY